MWSVDAELLEMSGCSTVTSAVLALNIFPAATSETRIECIRDWSPGGAECYIYVFRVKSGTNYRDLILKAFTPPLGTSPELAMQSHIERASQLQVIGVRTPTIFGARAGTILMKYVPYDLYEYLEACSSSMREVLGGASDEIRERLARGGWRVVDGALDLRTDGTSLYMVDLGCDLVRE